MSFHNSRYEDPVALDYWASKNVLIPTAMLNYDTYSSLDPDYEPLSPQYSGGTGMDEAFHNYLRRSMDVLINGGLQATMNQTEMNVFVTALEGTDTADGLDPLTLAIIVILPLSAGIIVILVIFVKRRKKE